MAKKKPKNEDPRDKIIYTQSFAGVIRKGEDRMNKLVVKSQRWYQHCLNKFKDGEVVSWMRHNEKPKRTERQNRYYWGVSLPLIAKEKNEPSLDRLHELFKGEFLTEGIVDVLGEQVRMKRSTTELGVGEFCDYILAIESLTEVEAPPTESWQLAPLRGERENGKSNII